VFVVRLSIERGTVKVSTDEYTEEGVYQAVNSVLERAGLMRRRVLDTPGWENAKAAVQGYCESVGWLAPPMGPANGDTWSNWLHILSHTLDKGGHSLTHAKMELRLAELAIAALEEAGAPSA
jgi:hypothetical protein